ncbi:unnamed protein product [Discula destructiva]
MTSRIARVLAIGLFALFTICVADSEGHQYGSRQEDGYIGYRLDQRGDPESAIYETANTNTGAGVLPVDPDVYLNASVSVGEIAIEVNNLTAVINLQADVLKLLTFSAGVTASVDRVKLTIQNVSAKVLLEARLENVVTMIGEVLDAIDLNPLIATLGTSVSTIVNSTGDALSGTGSSSSPTKRSYDIDNVLYSINDYSGNTHTNRILAQDGILYDVKLNNDGDEQGKTLVGSYATSMTFSGHNETVSINGQVREYELQYFYNPFPGIESIVWVYVTPEGAVTRTQVVAEAFGGGSSTISDDSETSV